MSIVLTRIIRADHPSLPGHFPNAPIVPGVIILEEVAAAAIAAVVGRGSPPAQNAPAAADDRGDNWQDRIHLTEVKSVKFLRPLRPGEEFTISIEPNETQIDFRCRTPEGVLAEGRLEVSAK